MEFRIVFSRETKELNIKYTKCPICGETPRFSDDGNGNYRLSCWSCDLEAESTSIEKLEKQWDRKAAARRLGKCPLCNEELIYFRDEYGDVDFDFTFPQCLNPECLLHVVTFWGEPKTVPQEWKKRVREWKKKYSCKEI